jgi:hypothetical protein
MTTVKPGCYQRKRRTAWSGCGLGDGRSVGRFVCCAACVLSSCDISGRCVSTTHQHTLVARGGLGLARNTHRHTYAHYTHYTPTQHNTPTTPTGYSRGAPGVLPGYARGTPQVPLHRIRPALPWVRPRPSRAARADLTLPASVPRVTPQVRARSVVRQSIRGQRRGVGRGV